MRAGTGSQGELSLTGPAPAERGWRRGQHSHSALCPYLLGIPRSSALKRPWACCLSFSPPIDLCTLLSGAPISAALLLCPAWSWPLSLHCGCFQTFFPLLGGSGEASLWGPGVTSHSMADAASLCFLHPHPLQSVTSIKDGYAPGL